MFDKAVAGFCCDVVADNLSDTSFRQSTNLSLHGKGARGKQASDAKPFSLCMGEAGSLHCMQA